MKTKTRGLGTLVAVGILIFGFMFILRDDDEMGKRAVHFSASWVNKQEQGSIEYGIVGPSSRRFAKSGSPWDEDLFAEPGDRVRLHVQFTKMEGPELLACWITVNHNVVSAADPGQLLKSSECKVETIVQ